MTQSFTAHPVSAPRRRPNVLVIDDDRLLGDSLVQVLGDRFEVSVEREASDACHRLALGERFSAVLVDLTMPGMSGIELYTWMNGACPDQAERVLFITGAAPNGPYKRFLDHVADRVVAKPFEKAALVSRVEALLSGG